MPCTQVRQGNAMHAGEAGQCNARSRGQATQGKARATRPSKQGQLSNANSNAEQVKERHGRAGQGEANARQGKAMPSKSRGKQGQEGEAMPIPSKARPRPMQGNANAEQVNARARPSKRGQLGQCIGRDRGFENDQVLGTSLAGQKGEKSKRCKGEGRIEATRAESQWIVAARPLCHLQYPVAYLSRLQRILPAAR